MNQNVQWWIEMCSDESKCAVMNRNVQWWIKMCSDESKCAVMNRNVQWWIEMCIDERLFVQCQKKVIRKFVWINRNILLKKVVQKLESSFCYRNVQWWIFLKTCSGPAHCLVWWNLLNSVLGYRKSKECSQAAAQIVLVANSDDDTGMIYIFIRPSFSSAFPSFQL